MEQSATNQPELTHERFEECYLASKSELDAIPESELMTVNLDPYAIVMTVKKALPRCRPLREALVSETTRFDITLLERLDTYAGALWHTQSLLDMATKAPAHVLELAERATSVRDLVLTDVNLMIKHGLLPSGCLANLQGVPGYRATAADITMGVNTLRANQDKVKGRSSLSLQDLADYEVLAGRLVTAAAEREQAQAAASQVIIDRQRAYTAVVRGYEELRHAVTYVRRKFGDQDEYAESLWAGRGGRRKPEGNKSPELPATQPPSALPPQPAGAAPQAHGFSAAASVPVGLPGGDPLLPA